MEDPTSRSSAGDPGTQPSDLGRVVRDLESHVAADGWDQPTRLFALVPRAVAAQALGQASDLGRGGTDQGTGPATGPADASTTAWAALEQGGLPPHDDAVSLLALVEWPPEVAGAAVAFETVLVDAAPLPADPVAARQAAAHAPGRQEARLVLSVLRDGPAATALRWRAHDDAEDVSVGGAELAPALTEALRATFRPSP